ncbi:MAG: hypothetical protein HQM02_01240 [Magnetococcales bacterium]|nr:hypothetical protein [Magnetococcales bacterium]
MLRTMTARSASVMVMGHILINRQFDKKMYDRLDIHGHASHGAMISACQAQHRGFAPGPHKGE